MGGLISTFFNALLGGILSAEKKTAEFIGAISDQNLILSDQAATVSATTDQTATELLSGYEKQLQSDAQKKTMISGAFVILMVILAIYIVYLIS